MIGKMTKFASMAAAIALVFSASPVLAWGTVPSPPSSSKEEVKISNSNEAEIYNEVKSIANTGKNEIDSCLKEKDSCKPECNKPGKFGYHKGCKKINYKNQCKKECNKECECPTIETKSAKAFADSVIKANENEVSVPASKDHKLTIENENSAYVESSVVSVANTGKNKISGSGSITTQEAFSSACSSILVNSNIVEIEK